MTHPIDRICNPWEKNSAIDGRPTEGTLRLQEKTISIGLSNLRLVYPCGKARDMVQIMEVIVSLPFFLECLSRPVAAPLPLILQCKELKKRVQANPEFQMPSFFYPQTELKRKFEDDPELQRPAQLPLSSASCLKKRLRKSSS